MDERNSSQVSDFSAQIGRELRGAMTTSGYTLTAMERAVGHNKGNLSLWLNGKRELPLGVLYKICQVINMDPTEIIRRATTALDRTTND